MKKLICILLLCVLCFFLAGCGNQKDENSINAIIELITSKDYQEASVIIKNKDLLKNANNEITDILLKELINYKVANITDFSELTDDDWKYAKELNNVFDDLKLKEKDNKFKYIDELLKLEDAKKYIPAIQWYTGFDYTVWQSYIEFEYESDFTKIANMLPNYSFEKYGLENVYIKELNDEKSKYAKYCKLCAEALKTKNKSKFDSARDELEKSIFNIADIAIKIITAKGDLENKIANLPKW